MTNLRWVTGLAITFFLAAGSVQATAEEEYTSFEEKARRSHNLSMSDVIYQQEDFRALYYQNEVIIQVLKEIREEMHSANVRDAKEGNK